jgi:hypothetical protein
MRVGRSLIGIGIRPAVFLLVGVMLLRSLVPAGFMPDPVAAHDGAFRLIFCSGPSGAGTAASGVHASEHGPGHPPPASDQCQYAVLAAPVLAAADAAAVPMPPATAERHAILAGSPRLVAPELEGGWARAPPEAA